MSKTAEKQRVPIRAIIMILIALAIAFAAFGWHGFTTRNDADNAALLAQEAKLSQRAPARTSAAPAPQPVCLLVVGDPANKQNAAAIKSAKAKLTAAKIDVTDKAVSWPTEKGAPAAPKALIVYSVDGQDQAAKDAAAAIDAKVAARPDGLAPCASAVTVVVP